MREETKSLRAEVIRASHLMMTSDDFLKSLSGSGAFVTKLHYI